jgi:hypothetical protein
MRRYLWILVAFAVALFLWVVYLQTRLPPGVEAKGPADTILPWVTLAGSIVSLLTGLIGLLVKVRNLMTAKKASVGDD